MMRGHINVLAPLSAGILSTLTALRRTSGAVVVHDLDSITFGSRSFARKPISPVRPAVSSELAKQETDRESREQALSVIYYAMGDRAESDPALQRLLYLPAALEFDIASVYAYRWERDLAFDY